jgi:CubicO group peptidase (beta-lactamase class C family)
LWTIVIVLFCLVLVVWMTGYSYIFKTLVYTYPGIDDLDLFESRAVNDGQAQQWPVSDSYNGISLSKATEEEIEKNGSTAFLVVKDDSIIYERYWSGYGDTTISNSFSVAKSIVGILAGIALHEGTIALDDRVGKYIPEYNEGDNSRLTLRHLLMMASGLNWDESYNSLFSLTTEAYYGKDLTSLVRKLRVVEEPGKTFRYMSCNTVLIAMAIAKASGMSLSEYASEKLWKPIGAEHAAMWSLDDENGVEKSYCCFYSTARDFARIGKLCADSGMWHGLTILPAWYIAESMTPAGLKDESGDPVDYYGYHWWILNRNGHKIFYARGILGQYIIVVPAMKMVIVRLGKERGEKTGNHYSDMIAYLDGVMQAFHNPAQP